MMSLRLLRALLSALFGPLIQAIAERTRTHGKRTPSYGPSGPWARHHVAAIHLHRRTRMPELLRRPAPVRAPDHILAILAQAPDVEPEFASLRASTYAPAHPTVLPAPTAEPPATITPATRRRRLHAPRTWLAGIGLRLSRGCRAVAEWLVFDSPPPARA